MVLELLLQNLAASAAGIDSAAEATGKNPLHLAVAAGREVCVMQLITRGANISHADASHRTPMQAASELGLTAISDAMLNHKLAQDEKLLRQLDLE